IDVTALKDGFHGDTSATFYVGNVSDEAKKITEVAKAAMMAGINAIGRQTTTGDIGFAVNKYVTREGFHVVREIGGHGIGRGFHEDPFVPSFGKKGRGDRLMVGGTITVEPMVNQTSAGMIEHEIKGSRIQWYTMEDKSLSAQFEHTVLITEDGARILTGY
ncbi:MAG: M24 family metallopeptidase, partial [Proteobacteria bacterium]